MRLIAFNEPQRHKRPVEDRTEAKLTERRAIFGVEDVRVVALEQTAGEMPPERALVVAGEMLRDRRVLALENGRMTCGWVQLPAIGPGGMFDRVAAQAPTAELQATVGGDEPANGAHSGGIPGTRTEGLHVEEADLPASQPPSTATRSVHIGVPSASESNSGVGLPESTPYTQPTYHPTTPPPCAHPPPTRRARPVLSRALASS